MSQGVNRPALDPAIANGGAFAGMASPTVAMPITVASPHIKQEQEKRATVTSSIINLLATAMGGGLLSLPRALADSGCILGGLFLMGSGVACAYSLVILVMCARDSGKSSFEGNAEFFLGKCGARVVNICLVVLLLFATAAMCVIMMDLAPPVLQLAFGHVWALDRVLVGLYMNAIMFPLSIQLSINVLRYTSFLALSCIGYFFVCLIIKFCEDPHVEQSVAAVGPISKILEGLPIMFSAFLCQFNIFKIDYELCEEDKPKITRVILIAIPCMAATIYVCGGLIGYFLLGDLVANNLLKNWSDDLKFTVARGMLSMTNMFKVPLLMIPFRESVVELLGLDKDTWNRPMQRFGMTLLLNSLAFGLACVLKSLSKVLGLLGCTSGILISFILPALMFLEHIKRVETNSGSVLHSFGNLSVIADPIDPRALAAAGSAQVSHHSKATFWMRKAPAWTLIIAALAAGGSSLVDMIVNWKEA